MRRKELHLVAQKTQLERTRKAQATADARVRSLFVSGRGRDRTSKAGYRHSPLQYESHVAYRRRATSDVGGVLIL